MYFMKMANQNISQIKDKLSLPKFPANTKLHDPRTTPSRRKETAGEIINNISGHQS